MKTIKTEYLHKNVRINVLCFHYLFNKIQGEEWMILDSPSHSNDLIKKDWRHKELNVLTIKWIDEQFSHLPV